jgi:hypothetical protein
MKPYFVKIMFCLVWFILSFGINQQSVDASSLSVINIARNAVVITDSGDGGPAIDGENFATSWVSANTSADHWLELRFVATEAIRRVVLVKGNNFSNYQIQTWNGTGWNNANVTRSGGSNQVEVITLNPAIATSRLRLYVSSGTQVSLREIQVFRDDPQPIFVNQSGYETNRPKRFTAPLTGNGIQFTVTTAVDTTPLFSGTITDGVGDFSTFNPVNPGPYVIRIGTATSVPFGIGPYWIQRVSLQPAINFMVDVRCRNGNATGISPAGALCGTGVAWRDSHQFSFELNTLIAMYASNPDAYSTIRMPVQASYTGLRQTLPSNTPEIVRLIYWAVEVYLQGDVNHTLLKEQLAYFVYAYPGLLDAYIPVEVYIEARDYLFANWGNTARDRWNWFDITHTADLFQVYTVIGTGKGSFPPGHSIIPNLLMYEVAVREGRTDAPNYFIAAYNNAAWIMANLSPSDVTVTKGQRMSEHLLIPSLVYFQHEYPSTAPSGIVAYVDQWTNTMIARSQNYWDFRRYSDNAWTIPSYNEPGNVAGFPASALAAASIVSTPANAGRLRQLAVAQIDNVFGRNPYGRHFSANATRDFEGVELGWFSEYSGGAGSLNNARGVFDGAPQSDQYPFNPHIGPGYTEGWVAFNTAWNITLAYLAWEDTSLWVYDPNTNAQMSSVMPGQTLGIQLRAPLNFNYSTAETGQVTIRSTGGDILHLTVNEISITDLTFANTVQVQSGSVNTADAILQASPGEFLEVTYGYQYWGECLIIPVFSGGTPPSTQGMSCGFGASNPLPVVPSATATVTPTPTATPLVGGIIMDNADTTGVTFVGSWTTSTYDPGYYGSNYLHDGNTDKGSKSVTFTPALSSAGQYDVFMQWSAAANRATNVPVIIQHNGGSSTVTVNQRQNSGQWVLLGTFALTPGSSSVTITTTGTTGHVIVDAVRFIASGTTATLTPSPTVTATATAMVTATFTPTASATPTPTATLTATPLPPSATATPTAVPGTELIIDDAAASGVTLIGEWTVSTYDPGYYGSNYLHDGNTAKGTRSVVFTPSLTAAGSYEVFVQWSAAPNRASNVPIVVQHSVGSTTVTVNQQQNGGQWISLGIFTLNPGATSVTITTTGTNGFVIADAVRFVPR